VVSRGSRSPVDSGFAERVDRVQAVAVAVQAEGRARCGSRVSVLAVATKKRAVGGWLRLVEGYPESFSRVFFLVFDWRSDFDLFWQVISCHIGGPGPKQEYAFASIFDRGETFPSDGAVRCSATAVGNANGLPCFGADHPLWHDHRLGQKRSVGIEDQKRV